MDKTLTLVTKFLDVTTNQKDIKGARDLMADNLTFVGPLIQTSGAQECIALLEEFLPAHVDSRIIKQFEIGNDVCIIDDLTVRTPAGGTIAPGNPAG